MSYNLTEWAKNIADAIRYQSGNDESYKILPYNFPLEIEALTDSEVDVTNGELTDLPQLCENIASSIRTICWCDACCNGDSIAPIDFADHIMNIVYGEEGECPEGGDHDYVYIYVDSSFDDNYHYDIYANVCSKCGNVEEGSDEPVNMESHSYIDDDGQLICSVCGHLGE